MIEVGRPYDIAPTGPSDIRRIEAGILNYGIDMTLENNPFEVGLGWMVKLDQDADFIGKEALRRIEAEGAKRTLVGIAIAGERLDLNMTAWVAKLDGKQIGSVTSAVYSPRLKKNIGYAMVPTEHADLGTTFTIETPVGDGQATVVPKPFVDPKKEVPKA